MEHSGAGNGAASERSAFLSYIPLASCFLSSDGTSHVDRGRPEDDDDAAPEVQEEELTAAFESPGVRANLSGINFTRWMSLQMLCAKLGRTDTSKSEIFLDDCSMGRHGAVVVARTFTHVFVRGGNHHAQWLPLMYQNSRIKVMSLMNNNIGPDGAAAFASMLRVNAGLRELNLNSNSIRCDGLQYLASAMFVNDTLRFLCLSDNEVCGIDDAGEGEYDPSGLASLARVLKENKTLRTLKIAENEIRDHGAALFGDLFEVGCELRALDISSNNLLGDAEAALSAGEAVGPRRRVPILVADESSPLTAGARESPVSFQQGSTPRSRAAMRPGQGAVGEGGKKFLSSLRENCKLTHIDLSFNDMGPRCAAVMSDSLKLNRSLLCLELRGNPIKCDGLIAIADFLAGPNSIRVLGIERCAIGARGTKRFAEVLATNEPLRKLNMSLNDIGDEGANHLSKALKLNTHLRYLYLHRCNLGSEGVAYVSSMLQVNASIRHLGLSCNNMGDTGLMALSATILLNRSLVSLDISETKLRRRQAKVSKIGPVAWAALAGMIKENSRLKILNITGYSIPPESLDTILDAMNSRRVCLVKADFGQMRWKYDACVQSIDAERQLLGDTAMAPLVRVNVCGETAIGKSTALKGWIRITDSSIVTPMFTGIFGLGIFMQPVAEHPPTIFAEVHSSKLGELPLQVWDFGGLKQFQHINHTAIGGGPAGLFVICVNAVWGKEQCRSYLHVADELTLWVRLVMTLGHKESDIAIVFLRGRSFDRAWAGKDPAACGRLAGTARQKQAQSDLDHGDARLRDDMWQSRGVKDYDNPSAYEIDATADDAGGVENQDARMTDHIRKHRQELEERELAVEGYDNESATTPKASDVSVTTSAVTTEEDVAANDFAEISLNSTHDTVRIAPSDQPSAQHNFITMDPDARAAAKELQASNDSEEHDPVQNHPSEDDHRSTANGNRQMSSDELAAERRRYFQEAVQERMASVLKWNRLPQLFLWDEGEGKELPELVDWIKYREGTVRAELKTPKISSIVLEKCLPVFAAKNCKIVSFDALMAEVRTHIRSLMPGDLMVALNWLHRLGYLFIIAREGESYIPRSSICMNNSPAVRSKKQEVVNSLKLDMDNGDVDENSVRGESGADAFQSCLDRSPMRSFGPQSFLETKIVLDLSWFFGLVIGPVVAPRDVLPPSVQHQLPWGNKDYLLSLRQIVALCESDIGPIQNVISAQELVGVLENLMVGTWCGNNYMFIPARLTGDKSKWLKQRQIANLPLSQFGSGSDSGVQISAAIGRRILPRAPYLLPHGTFFVLQAILMQQYERNEWSGFSITCWERGVGIVVKPAALLGPEDKSDPRHSVCAIIEQVGHDTMERGAPAADGMQNDSAHWHSVTDIIVWSEGADCPVAAVQSLLSRCLHLFHQAVMSVLGWPPRPEKFVITSGAEGSTFNGNLYPEHRFNGDVSKEDEMFLSRVLRTEFLRPGCILHSLALNPRQRQCAVYEDDSIINVSAGISGSHDDSEELSPILVCCDHMQPRLLKRHLTCGYVLSESPGGGRAMLRAIAGALQSTLGASESHSTSTTSDLGIGIAARVANGASNRAPSGSRGGVSPRSGMVFPPPQTPPGHSGADGDVSVNIDIGTPASVASSLATPFDTPASRRSQGSASGSGRTRDGNVVGASPAFEDMSSNSLAVFSTDMSNTE